jgi:hypothetical protein
MQLALRWHATIARPVVKHLALHAVSNCSQLKLQHTPDESFPHLAAHLKAFLELNRINLLITTQYGRVVDVLCKHSTKKGVEKVEL